ncbi:MAG: glycosyltransferase family 39 protein [FCB group bacterium]|nr:glycosyltransferase family 39 protein [FCB group bacterium]
MMTRFLSTLLKSDEAYPFFIAFASLILHLIFIGQYDYFRDEFYYIACGQHLAWGYVDHPPLIGVISGIAVTIFGKSLFGIRILSILAGATVVYLSGLICRELGGKRFAMSLTSIAVAIAPINLFLHHVLSMNSFDHFFWTLAILIFIKILKNGQPKLWILFGIILGIGLLNKISVLFLGFGLFVGLLATEHRRMFLHKWLWVTAGIAGLMFIPHIIWQIANGWPTLEFMHNAATYKNIDLAPVQFLLEHMFEINPISFVLLAMGLGFFLFSNTGSKFRIFGWLYLAIYILFNFQNAKTYYLAPAYPLMLAGGAVFFENLTSGKVSKLIRPVYLLILIVLGGVMAPITLPCLPLEKFIEYQKKLGLQAEAGENHEMGVLPQHYADMFGWREMVETVALVYNSLPPEDREACSIFGQNYGEAGAVDYFGYLYNLPPAVSLHNNYWIWGPGERSGEVLIIIGGDREDFEQVYDSVEEAAIHSHPYAMPYESNLPIYVCRGLKVKLEDIWAKYHSFN